MGSYLSALQVVLIAFIAVSWSVRRIGVLGEGITRTHVPLLLGVLQSHVLWDIALVSGYLADVELSQGR